MQRPCDRCGKPYHAERPNSRFCSDTCRVQAGKARKAGLPESLGTVTDLPTEPRPSSTTDAVRAELVAAGQLDSALGQLSMTLATRIDSGHENGSAVAALSNQLRATLALVLKDAPRAANALDELRERRRARTAEA